MEPVRIEFLMVDKLSGRLGAAEKKMEDLSASTSEADARLKELDKSGAGLQKTLGKLATAFTVKELVSKITRVRGEFQQLEVAFETMLGSAEQAQQLMSQLTATAATTPFGLEDVSQGAKQLLAYGFEAEKVNETLIRLGDIAAGLSVPLNDLVYLYGTTMAQGRLYTQDLNQFTGRGIPMISEFAKQFGVAESNVKDLVEAGKVGFPEVQKVIESLTSEGGKFGGLMEAQSKTITGQISNIEDALQMMLNDLGHQSEGIINASLSGVSYMVEHYEQFGRVLLGLVGTYGVYRTAIMTVTAARGLSTAAEALHYGWLVMVEKAHKLLNATMLSNPYVLVATAIAGVVAAMVSLKTETERLRSATESYDEQRRKAIEAEESHKRKIEELCSIAGNEAVATDVRREALTRLEQQYPSIFAKYDTEYSKLKNIKAIKEEIALYDSLHSLSNPSVELQGVAQRIKELEGKPQHTMKYDPGQGRYVRKSGRTPDEEAELQMLYKKRASLSSELRKSSATAYFEHLTGISNDTLSQMIRQRETLLSQMTLQEKKYGKITYGASPLRGTYSRDELQYQLNKLRSEQSRRAQPTESSTAWTSAARKRYETALKTYNTFIQDTSNHLTQEEFEKKAKELKEAVDSAKKEYDKVTPGIDSAASKEKQQQEREERERERRQQLLAKDGQELAALQRSNAALEIAAMEDGLEKKLRQIENDYQTRKSALEKQADDWQRDNKSAGLGDSLTSEQQSALDEGHSLNESERRRSIASAYQDEFNAMRDHLRAYGTYQQQKLAITEEYAEKIRKAVSATEKQSLGVERDSLLSGLASQELKASIDWSVVFGEFGSMFHDLLQPELDKAKAYTLTAEFRNSDAQSQETLLSAIRQMEQSLGSADKVSFKKLGAEITAYEKSLSALREAQADYASTYETLTSAQQAYLRALQSGTKEEQSLARTALENAESEALAASTTVSTLQSLATSAQSTVTETANGLRDGMDGVVDGLRQIASGSLTGAYEGLIKFGHSAAQLGGSLSDSFKKVSDAIEDVPIIGWIVQIIDLFKDGLSVVVEGILDAVFNAVSGILSDVLSGDLFVTIGDSLLGGIGKIFDSITFGGFSSWISSSNAKDVQSTLERLTDRNERLQGAIEDLTDEMSSSKGTKSVSAYREAYRYQQETNRNYLQMAQAQAGYHDSHHSWNYYWGGYSDDQVSRLSGQIGRQWDGSLWSLSPEEMKVLRSNVDMWDMIKNTGKGPYGAEVQNKLDDYIAQAGKLEDLTTQLYEGLTGITFDAMYDSFIDQLMDMDSSAEDFAGNVSEYFMRAMLSNKIGELYSERLEGWWKRFGQSMEDNDLSEWERKSLQDEYMAYVDEAMRLRDQLAAATGYDQYSGGSSQSAKVGTFSAMTQEQGTKLEGMFTSGLQHWSSMDARLEDVASRMAVAEGHLAKIEENTGRSSDHLGDINESFKKIIRDGLKVV